MGFKIFGIMTAEVPDKVGETIQVKGVNLQFCRYISDEHADGPSTTVGAITRTKKILKESDCSTPREKRCWEAAKVPLVYFEGELADGEGHANAAATAALIAFTASRPELPLKVGASIEGYTLGRAGDKDTEKGKIITGCLAEGLAVTTRSCNPICQVWPWSDIKKSEIEITDELLDRLVAESTTKPPLPSIRESKRMQRQQIREAAQKLLDIIKSIKPETLKKSLDDWNKGGQCEMKCHKCQHTEKLEKASRNFKNRCPKCGHPFTMSDFWNALNQ
jgi:hypothetical protein